MNIALKISSWRHKNSLKRSVVVKDGKIHSTKRPINRNRVAPNASFLDGVATKDCIIDPSTELSIRIFLPHHCLQTDAYVNKAFGWLPEKPIVNEQEKLEDVLKFSTEAYFPSKDKNVHLAKLPVIVQFHNGAFISGSKDSTSNDLFCRRIAKACKSIVVAVGYRLSPEHRYPASRDDGLFTLHWLAKQANLAQFPSSIVSHGIIECFGNTPVDPWISAHLDSSRCVLMGIGAGGTIAQQVAQASTSLKLELEPLKVVSQVLIYPLFSGPSLLPSEVGLSDAYFMDKDTLALAWRCFLPEGEYSTDHSAVDPLKCSKAVLSRIPSTLVISADLDMLRDRAAAYVEALKKAQVDATFLVYRNAVHGFATVESLMNTKLARACVEDIALWFAKHVRCDYWS